MTPALANYDCLTGLWNPDTAELLAEYERSGLSGPAFARVTGINYQTFAWWRQEQRKAHSALMPATQK